MQKPNDSHFCSSRKRNVITAMITGGFLAHMLAYLKKTVK